MSNIEKIIAKRKQIEEKIKNFDHLKKFDEILNKGDIIGCQRQLQRLKLLFEQSRYDLQDIIIELIDEMYAAPALVQPVTTTVSTPVLEEKIKNLFNAVIKKTTDQILAPPPEDSISISKFRELLQDNFNEVKMREEKKKSEISPDDVINTLRDKVE